MPDKVFISSKPELELLIVVSGVLNACARPSSTAQRNCSLCRAASAPLSTEKERSLSMATAVSDAAASIDTPSSSWPQTTNEPTARAPRRKNAR